MNRFITLFSLALAIVTAFPSIASAAGQKSSDDRIIRLKTPERAKGQTDLVGSVSYTHLRAHETGT